MEGIVHNYKVSLVIKGFTQKHDINNNKTFSLIVMLKSIQIVLAVTIYFNYRNWQIDVQIAFLNGNLVKDMYMAQHDSFVVNGYASKACKLRRSIYGLNQDLKS